MIRNDWSRAEIQEIYDLPLMDLLFQAQQIHRQTLNRILFRSVLCFQLKRAVVRKIVNTVRNLHIMILIWKLKNA